MSNLSVINLDSKDFYLDSEIVDILTNEIDGILCASALMEYAFEFRQPTNQNKAKKSTDEISFCFYKGEDFYFEITFIYAKKTKVIDALYFHYSLDNVGHKKPVDFATNLNLKVDFFDTISVYNSEDMKKVMQVIKYIL